MGVVTIEVEQSRAESATQREVDNSITKEQIFQIMSQGNVFPIAFVYGDTDAAGLAIFMRRMKDPKIQARMSDEILHTVRRYMQGSKKGGKR